MLLSIYQGRISILYSRFTFEGSGITEALVNYVRTNDEMKGDNDGTCLYCITTGYTEVYE